MVLPIRFGIFESYVPAEPGLTTAQRGCRVVRKMAQVALEGFVEVSPILRSGVYALCAKGVVIYVGKSRAMIARINTHRRAWIDKRKGAKSWLTDSLGIPALLFDEIHIRPCPPHKLDEVEREMINRYKPRYNVQLKTPEKVKVPISLTVSGVVLALNAQTQRVVVERRI